LIAIIETPQARHSTLSYSVQDCSVVSFKPPHAALQLAAAFTALLLLLLLWGCSCLECFAWLLSLQVFQLAAAAGVQLLQLAAAFRPLHCTVQWYHTCGCWCSCWIAAVSAGGAAAAAAAAGLQLSQLAAAFSPLHLFSRLPFLLLACSCLSQMLLLLLACSCFSWPWPSGPCSALCIGTTHAAAEQVAELLQNKAADINKGLL
jgi:hypothetical protein